MSYVSQEKLTHSMLNIRTVGLLVDHRRPYLAASPDGLVTCQCCSDRLLEIKCPYKHRDSTIKEIRDKDFCLDSHLALKQTHRYYTQIQLQMEVFQLQDCDFFIFTNKDSFKVTVKKNQEFCDNLIDRCGNFFFKNILPELITRKLEHEDATTNPSQQNQLQDQDVWCLCQEPEYGRMIQCANEDCPTVWFHYECVNLRRCPRGRWICPNCSDI